MSPEALLTRKSLAIGTDKDGVLKRGPATAARLVGHVIESRTGQGRRVSRMLDGGMKLFYKVQPMIEESYHGLKSLVEEAKQDKDPVQVEIFTATPQRHQEITETKLSDDGFMDFIDKVTCTGFSCVVQEKGRWVNQQLREGFDVIFIENDRRIAEEIASQNQWTGDNDPKAVIYLLSRWKFHHHSGNGSNGLVVPVTNFQEILADFRQRSKN